MIETKKNEYDLDPYGNRSQYARDLSSASIRYQKFSSIVTNLSWYPSHIRYNLTISDEKKFVWFRVPKVATRAILFLLSQANIQLTAEHASGCHYPVNKHKDYYKFAFVRNPWDRLVSCWQDKIVDHHRLGLKEELFPKLQEFENFVDYVSENIDLEYGNRHLRLQCRMIDLNHIDYLGRFEKFTADLKEIKKALGITAFTKKMNASKRKVEYREYYNDRVKDKVAELYRRDIQIFNYEF
jgi:hypothetical protein